MSIDVRHRYALTTIDLTPGQYTKVCSRKLPHTSKSLKRSAVGTSLQIRRRNEQKFIRFRGPLVFGYLFY